MFWSVRGRRLVQRLARVAGADPAKEEREDLLARLDKLQDAANSASSHARNVYITFLLFGLYLAIIFGSTTHEQLLREAPVTLPLLNVGLPLFGFYWIAPALLVLLHLNLLLQFYLLSDKLHRFDRALEQALAKRLLDRVPADERRAQLYQFPFSQMMVGRQHGRLMRFLLWLVVWLTVLMLPVLLLLLGQIRFLPYHDPWTTMWQRFMVLADLLLILIFWRAIRHPVDRLLTRPGRWIWHQAKVALPAVVALTFSFLIFTFPGDYPTTGVRAPHSVGDPMEEALLDRDGWLAWAYPKSWRINQSVQRLPYEAVIFWPTMVTFELLPFLDRNLIVREANLVASWPTRSQIEQFGEDLAWRNFGASPDFHGRDLRFANFDRSIIVRANLRGASLQGASLEVANLQGASLWDSNLQGANLEDANLRAASFDNANLEGARLDDSDSRGAQFGSANLKQAFLDGANFGGAYFRSSNLQSADLHGSNLQGADLRKTNLQGADLQGADVRGADLTSATLWRAALGGEEDLRSRWGLADLTGVVADLAGVVADLTGVVGNCDADEPIDDLEAWIEKKTAEIADEATRRQVIDRVTIAVDGPNLQEIPRFPKAWRTEPDIMFDPGECLPKQLGWGQRAWGSRAAYDISLAGFLGDLACREDGVALVLVGLVRRVLEDENRLYAKRLARRLIDCLPPSGLSEPVRRYLERLASHDE